MMTTFSDMSNVVGVAGDWHGDTGWALNTLRMFARLGVTEIHQLGDFGVWGGYDGASFRRKVERTLALNNQTLFVTDGNHEDHARIAGLDVLDNGLRVFTDHAFILPRVWKNETLGGRVLGSLGGAASIDFSYRTKDVDWWPQEAITLGDLYAFRELGKLDVMFAHERPSGVDVFPDGYDNEVWPLEGLGYAEESSNMMRVAVDAAKPELFFHGHYHHFYERDVTLNDGVEDYVVRVVGLDMNGAKFGANALLDVETLEYKIL